ncbi:MAG: hypothetical protein WKF84_10915 [Pyrinomonadaceae bacterium]
MEKLGSFRFEYARMLRAHRLLSSRNYRSIQAALAKDINLAEQSVEAEQSVQVRYALKQNLNILHQRLNRVRKLEELVRLLEARLQIVRNSLSLIQDEVYTFTDVAGISGLVDNLLTNLSVSDEFRADYEDVLNAETDVAALSAIEAKDATPRSTAASFGAQSSSTTTIDDERRARAARSSNSSKQRERLQVT